MASGGHEAYDKNAAVKKNFFRKFGRRVGNVFARKRSSRGDLDDLPASTLPGMSSSESTPVIINPLMAADIPAASMYQSSRAYPIHTSDVRGKGSAGGMVSSTRLSGEFPAVSSAMSEESMSASGPPPERCLSEGNLVDSSSPRQDQLGGFGGRIWRAVPTSMESLPKSLQDPRGNKHASVSEDEGLPRSPSEAILDKAAGKTSAQLSRSARSLVSCDSDDNACPPLELDFNALRRAESLDNTAAKHKIQVSRPRKSRSAGMMAGGLRKHKSLSTVQLSGISEEAGPSAAPIMSHAASELAAELQGLQRSKEKGKAVKPTPSAAKPKVAVSISMSRPVRPTAVSAPSPDSKVTRLRSMFGPDAQPASQRPGVAKSSVVTAAGDTKTKKFQFGAHFTVPATKTVVNHATDKAVVSKQTTSKIREKKPAADSPRQVVKPSEDTDPRPVSKVMDLVRNFQRMQETTSG